MKTRRKNASGARHEAERSKAGQKVHARPSADEIAERHGVRPPTPAELKDLHAQILPPDGEG